MGIKGDIVSHTSDYFQELYDSCVKVIKSGKAYADDTEQVKVCMAQLPGWRYRPNNVASPL